MAKGSKRSKRSISKDIFLNCFIDYCKSKGVVFNKGVISDAKDKYWDFFKDFILFLASVTAKSGRVNLGGIFSSEFRIRDERMLSTLMLGDKKIKIPEKAVFKFSISDNILAGIFNSDIDIDGKIKEDDLPVAVLSFYNKLKGKYLGKSYRG